LKRSIVELDGGRKVFVFGEDIQNGSMLDIEFFVELKERVSLSFLLVFEKSTLLFFSGDYNEADLANKKA
jgi:hypothetical protein